MIALMKYFYRPVNITYLKVFLEKGPRLGHLLDKPCYNGHNRTSKVQMRLSDGLISRKAGALCSCWLAWKLHER